jgi:hypothetical protein
MCFVKLNYFPAFVTVCDERKVTVFTRALKTSLDENAIHVMGRLIAEGVEEFNWMKPFFGKVHQHKNKETCAVRSTKFINSTIPLKVMKREPPLGRGQGYGP